jgi:hypothetical protein
MLSSEVVHASPKCVRFPSGGRDHARAPGYLWLDLTLLVVVHHSQSEPDRLKVLYEFINRIGYLLLLFI